ncbi:alpha/beta hydrolase [Paenibacillus sp. ISL-20]|uniref:alpha/beta fold hydrolase n=1 Tax=Paenibacillus sp. ISL-20 TaxID=2819163 RepID=UPI003335CD59
MRNLSSVVRSSADKKSTYIIAVSAGGPTGVCFAAMFPDRVASLTLQSAVTKPWLKPQDKEYKLGRRIFKPSVEKKTWNMIALINNILPQTTFKLMLPSFSKLRFSEIRERFLIDLEQSQTDYTNELRSIRTPTLIQHSKNDSVVPLTHVEQAQSCIPHAEANVLDSWGHLIWIGQHARHFDEKLLHFLSSNQIYD